MRECLGKIAQHPCLRRLVHFRKQTNIIADGEEPLEGGPCIVVAADQGQAVGQPEGAEQENALTLGKPVDLGVGLIAVHETVGEQLASIASIVPRTRASSGGKKPTRGIMSKLASRCFEP